MQNKIKELVRVFFLYEFFSNWVKGGFKVNMTQVCIAILQLHKKIYST